MKRRVKMADWFEQYRGVFKNMWFSDEPTSYSVDK